MSVITAMAFGSIIGVGGLYVAIDKMEDSVATAEAPQVVEEIKQDIARLSEQSRQFDYINSYIAQNGKAPYFLKQN